MHPGGTFAGILSGSTVTALEFRMRTRLTAPIVLVASTLTLAPALSAQTLATADWLDWERVGDPRISPDGGRVVFTRSWIDKINDRWETAIWMVNADGSRARQVVEGSGPRWSPDGTRIAFTASDDQGRPQIFVRWMDAEGAVSQVTRLETPPTDVAWSPDGNWLAFRQRVPADHGGEDQWRIDLPRPEGANWTRNPRIVESLIYRQDRVGFVDEAYQHLFVVPADGGTPRQLTSGNFDHDAATWMPDGRGLVTSGLRREDAGYQWQESEIYRVDVATGAVSQLTTRRGPDRRPVPSPDGRLIAYVGHDTTAMDYIESAIYVMNADGSSPRALTASLDRSPGDIAWAPDGAMLYFTVLGDGYENVFSVSLTGTVRPVTTGKQLIGLNDVSRSGVGVGTREDAHHPPDVVTLRLANGRTTQLTHVNDDILAGKTLGEVEEITYPSFDGLKIQGWIVKPPDFDPQRDYPMMLVIHGGPHSMYHGGFNFGWQDHAARGYVVLYTNPRGSSGYGSEFGNAIQYNYPGDDFQDLMAGVDDVIARGYVDEDNLFVYGCSGGGVLTSWVVGHTDRFRAASANCPVINWFAFVGQVDGNYLRWYADFEHFPWEDPSEHIRRSPLMYVGNVTTPTMLMTGVLDMRTPISQTEQFYQALKAQGKPTAMIRFEGEWHGTSSRPSNFLRTQQYLRRWFERWGTHDDRRTISASPGREPEAGRRVTR